MIKNITKDILKNRTTKNNDTTILAMGAICASMFCGCNILNDDVHNSVDSKSVTGEVNTGNGKLSYESADVFAMDTYMNLTVYGDDAGKAIDAARDEIKRLDELFSAHSLRLIR